MASDFRNYSSYPLGLRNNNPGNLRYSAANNWKGQIGSNKGFAVFSNIIYGVRAFGIDLKGDIKKGKNTIEKLIYEFAPPLENNTENYINNVATASGFSRKQVLTPNIDTLFRLGKAMFTVELGQAYSKLISDKDILEGLGMITGIGGAVGGLSVNLGILIIIIAVLFIYFKL